MALIGSLAVNVVANTQKFSSGIGRARNEVKGFSGSLDSLKSSLSKVATAGLAALGIGGLGATIAKTLKDVDALAKSASRLNMPVKELQAYQYMAELSGVSTELITKAIGMLARKSSEASIGIGDAKDVIAELGLDASRLAATKPERQLGLIADQMRGLARADQIRISSKLFGEEGGVAMISLLKDGSAGLANMRKEFIATGAAIDDADATKIEQFNDAITKLKTIAGGAIRDFVIDVTPAALQIVSDMSHMMQRVREFETRTGAIKQLATGSVRSTSALLSGDTIGYMRESLATWRSILAAVSKPPVVLQGAGL